jgi:aldose 1-epimerase
MAAGHRIEAGSRDGFETIELVSPELRAAFVPRLNMIGCSLEHQGEELLGQRGGLGAYAEKGSTMGIPLLHPWANRLDPEALPASAERAPLRRDENGLPIHGLLAAQPGWTVTGSAADEEFASLIVRFPFAREDLLAAFPYPHQLSMHARLEGARLSITTTLTATAEMPVPVSFGYHPYLALPDGRYTLELAVGRKAMLDERGIPTGDYEAARPQRAYDDLYTVAGEDFVLASEARRVTVSFEEGYPWAQVFSPQDAGFVCFEPMTAPTNALASRDGLRLVEPGESFTARFSISVG